MKLRDLSDREGAMRLRIVPLPGGGPLGGTPFMFVLDRVPSHFTGHGDGFRKFTESWKEIAKEAGARTVIVCTEEIEL